MLVTCAQKVCPLARQRSAWPSAILDNRCSAATGFEIRTSFLRRARVIIVTSIFPLLHTAWVLGPESYITGNWRVTISTPLAEITGKAAFKEMAGKVTGWLGPSEDDPIPIDIIRKGNKVTIRTHPPGGARRLKQKDGYCSRWLAEESWKAQTFAF